MSGETGQDFDESRAIEERFMAEQATDSVEFTPHDQLSKLHADKAQATDTHLLTQETALDVKAVDGSVVIVAGGEATSLSPEAALRTSDRLSARARDADRQKLPEL